MSEYGRILFKNEFNIIVIKELPDYWKIKIAKYSCPFCGRNTLLKKENERAGKYLECIKCGRAYQ